MSKEVFVFIDLSGTTHPVGNLWIHERQGVKRSSFRYAPAWAWSNRKWNSWLQHLNIKTCVFPCEGNLFEAEQSSGDTPVLISELIIKSLRCYVSTIRPAQSIKVNKKALEIFDIRPGYTC